MKILQIVADGTPGGGTNHVMQLLTSIGSDHSCTLMCQKDSYLAEQASNAGIDVFGADFFRGRTDPKAVRAVANTIDEVRPDLVHCHGGRAAFFRSLRRCPVPSVYTVHGFHHNRKPFVPRTLGKLAEKWTIQRFDRVLFVAQYDHQLAVEQRLMPNEQSYRVIHNGILPLEPMSPKKRIGVGFVGRFVFQKNPQLFVEVAKHLPQVEFVMVGGGELEPEVKAMISDLGLSDRVKLLGSLDHASTLEVIGKLDVLLMTPRWEGLPLLPLEAMFMKVPVVSTSVGGIPEVITHNETGLLAGYEDAQELGHHVSNLLQDSNLRNRLVEQAYQKAHQQFSQDTMLEKIRQTYWDLTSTNKINSTTLEIAGPLVESFSGSADF